MKIIGLYQAKVKRLGPKNELTGIYKYPVNTVIVDNLGIQGDTQIDKRYHGGPERALHQYALGSYEQIIKGHPLLHKKAQPGSMGENLTIAQMNEKNVFIGDIYQMGQCKVQVSGPRMPCYKISEKFNWPKLDRFVAKHAIHGWYYRIIEGGALSLGDNVTLINRPCTTLSIADFLQVVQGNTTEQALIDAAINAEGLDPEWKEKLKRKHRSGD
jgi:MOSC domain-containing protein YiiM